MSATSTASGIPVPVTVRKETVAVGALTNITKRYGNGIVALDNISLDLRRGEVVALLGPNGAGKSTAVKLLMGLTSPTTGHVAVFGGDPRDTVTRLRTGVMLQIGTAPQMLRVREQVELFRGYYRHPLAYGEIVHAAGLQGFEQRFFGQLSGGQKQRVLFALAIAGDPDLVFLDEPTVGLDIEARRLLWAAIRSLSARGKTVLLTTHYLEEADALADRIVVINKGRVICSGTSAEVKSLGSHYSGSARLEVKIIRCVTALSHDLIKAMPGVSHTESAGSATTLVMTTEPESTLREMLALDRSLNSLEVTSPALEDAFVALTSNA